MYVIMFIKYVFMYLCFYLFMYKYLLYVFTYLFKSIKQFTVLNLHRLDFCRSLLPYTMPYLLVQKVLRPFQFY